MIKFCLIVAALLVGTTMAQSEMFLFGDAVVPSTGVNISFSGCDPEHPAYCSWNLASTPLVEGNFSIFFDTGNLSVIQVNNFTNIVSGLIGINPPLEQGQIFNPGDWKIHIEYDIEANAGQYQFTRIHQDIGNMQLFGPAFIAYPDGYNVSVVECIGTECVWEAPAAPADVDGDVFLRLLEQDGSTFAINLTQTFGNLTIISGEAGITGVQNASIPQAGNYTVAIAYDFISHAGGFIFIHSSVPPPPPVAPVPISPPITPAPTPPAAPVAPVAPVTPPVAPVTPPTASPTASPDSPVVPPTSTIPESNTPAIAQAGQTTAITYGVVTGVAVIGAAIATIVYGVKISAGVTVV